MVNIEIRPSQPEDLDNILELQAIALRQLSFTYNSSQIESLVRSQAAARLMDEMGFIASNKGIMIGFAALSVDYPQITGIYVHPDFTRQGIGTKLIKFLEIATMNKGHDTLHTFSSLSAESFYRANGYRVVRASGFYSDTKTWTPCIQLKKRVTHVSVIQKTGQHLLSLISRVIRISPVLIKLMILAIILALSPLIVSAVLSLFR